jgi:cytochrome c oxidase subunit I
MKNMHPDKHLSLVFVYTAYLFFLVGTLAGLLQGMVRGDSLELPSWLGYYQILTIHGISLALLFTTYFIYGFYFAGMHRTMGEMTKGIRKTGWIGYWMMTIGTIMAVIMVLANKASVLYTFYAPLKASPYFYVGLALFVVGSWISGFAMIAHYSRWKKEHKDEIIPLLAHMVVGTIILWVVSCLGVAATVLFQLIPWSFGITDRINILLSRTLFWYFGHPLVYFWLLPAYVYWYVSVPKIIGGKLFSDSLSRLTFIMFLLFSIPVGFHHQLMEPGIDHGWKFFQVILTLMVVIPSLLTAFSMLATFENVGRAKGAKGLLGWWRKLPYHDVRFLAPLIGMFFFIPAGIGGIINASYQLDEIVHNTLWIVGHFHITVGAAVVMTFFGITFWLVPYLTGTKFTKEINQLGIVQIWTWAIGMFIMSTSMHAVGLEGAPRRTAMMTYKDHPMAQEWFQGLVANQYYIPVGAALLFISSLVMLYTFFKLVHAPEKAREGEEAEFPIGEAQEIVKPPKILDNWKFWTAVCFILIILAYGVPVWDMIQHPPPGSPGYRTW